MAKPHISAAGGFPALFYVLKKARQAGGLVKLYARLKARNACKTCALGMGGQKGGMVNEVGHFPEICKKSVQAQAGDMQGPISEAYFARTPIAAMEKLTSYELEHLGRLTFPIMAEPGDTHFRRVSWEHAIAHAGAAMKASPPEEVFFYSSGRASNEAAFLLQLVGRAFGTANIHNCSFYCHQASSVALARVYGSTTASVSLDDVNQTDLVMVVGANPASNHPRLITQLLKLRRRGGKVIVVNPIKELGLVRFRVPSDWRSMLFGSPIADLYLQPHIGGDVALCKALLKALLERPQGINTAFVRDHTQGFAAVQSDVKRARWDDLLAQAGVSRAEVEHAAHLIYGAERGIVMWAMGLTHHLNGVDNILALANLALARGWVGAPGAGLMPIRGHSNVQGVGSVGVGPQLKQAFADKLEQVYGVKVPRAPGQHTYASMEAAQAGKVRVAVLLGGNLYGSNPDQSWSGAALSQVGTILSITTKLNEGHLHGRGRTAIIVPARARDEESQSTTQESMFNYVRLSEGGPLAVPGEQRSEVAILADLAEAILPPGRFDWRELRSHAKLREAMARVVPGYEEMGQIDASQREFYVKNRLYHAPQFATPQGKAGFHVTPLPPPTHANFRLMTLRSEGQFNTVVYDSEDLYRGITRRDVVMMAAPDAARLGVREGQQVHVQTSVAAVQVMVQLINIRPGNIAMYYPEANVLVPRTLDPQSKTPAFKCVPAEVRPV